MPVEVERMSFDLKRIDISNHFLDILDAWITELHHLLAIQTDQMVVLSVEERCFVFSLRVAKLVAHDEVAFHEQTESIVDRRTAD